MHLWLVVEPPPEKYESIGMIISNIWENKKCSKPPTRIFMASIPIGPTGLQDQKPLLSRWMTPMVDSGGASKYLGSSQRILKGNYLKRTTSGDYSEECQVIFIWKVSSNKDRARLIIVISHRASMGFMHFCFYPTWPIKSLKHRSPCPNLFRVSHPRTTGSTLPLDKRWAHQDRHPAKCSTFPLSVLSVLKHEWNEIVIPQKGSEIHKNQQLMTIQPGILTVPPSCPVVLPRKGSFDPRCASQGPHAKAEAARCCVNVLSGNEATHSHPWANTLWF